MTLVAASLLFYLRIGVPASVWSLLPQLLLGGIGMALTMSPMTAAAMGSVPVDKAGVGSGVLNSFRQVGGSLGIGLMGAILAAFIHHNPKTDLPAWKQDYVNGMHAALGVSAAIIFVGAAVAMVFVRTRPAVVREHLAEMAA